MIQTLFENVRKMDRKWAESFVAAALALNAKAILVIAGFPCKGLSKARGKSRENFKNKDSILFWELVRILGVIQQEAGTTIPDRHIVENVMMDDRPEDAISKELKGRPTKTAAGPVCASNRDRHFWVDFNITPLEGERLLKGTRWHELVLKPNKQRLDFWDEGWGPSPSFKGSMPTMQGWQDWSSRPRDPGAIDVHSADAINRLAHDKHSSAITFYESYDIAYKGDALEADTPQEKDIRVISPTEGERLLGFPTDWTYC